jgi:hypothetical protein
MAIGSCLPPTTQVFSHWSSCGQTRPQMAELPLADGDDERRDVDAHRAAVDALGLLALEAALRLLHRQLHRVAEGNLVEVAHPRLGRLARHVVALDLHPLLLGQLATHHDLPSPCFRARHSCSSENLRRACSSCCR